MRGGILDIHFWDLQLVRVSKSRTPIGRVTQEMITAAMAVEDSFGHELRVASILRAGGCQVTHGWTYLDPVELKPRQFDLRCVMVIPGAEAVFQLAVECKNLQPDAPLIISGTGRTRKEAFNDFVEAVWSSGNSEPTIYRSAADCGPYKSERFVGKSILRLKRTDSGGLVTTAAGESDIYSRWSQALSSADHLCKISGQIAAPERLRVRSVILPFVVVPEETLWQMAYAADGGGVPELTPVEQTTFFVNHQVEVARHKKKLSLSHVHFFTPKGLSRFLSALPSNAADDWFPETAANRG